MRHVCLATAAVALALLLPTVSAAVTVTAAFNGGNSTTEIDGYPGKDGNGWVGPWGSYFKGHNTTGSGATVITPDGIDNVELASDTANYLSVTASIKTSMGSGTVGRNCAGTGGIDRTKPYAINFLYRVEESAADLAAEFTANNDRYQILEDDATALLSTNEAGTGWCIGAIGASGGTPSPVGAWYFFDGQGRTGGTGYVSVDTTIAVESGVTYQFEVAVDPTAKSWSGKVTNLATSASFTQDNLGWRIDTTDLGNPDAILSGMIQFNGRGSASGDVRHFSIDSLVISQTTASLPGDADGSGVVDNLDAAILASHWLEQIAGGPSVGDFNSDGRVNDLDASILAAHWTYGGAAAAVPEPSTLALLLGVLLLAVGRRRRVARP